jgi:hypothetical protein
VKIKLDKCKVISYNDYSFNKGNYTMIILKKWKHPDTHDNSDWFEITLEEATNQLEGSGCWKENTVLEMFENGIKLWNYNAHYKKKEER